MFKAGDYVRCIETYSDSAVIVDAVYKVEGIDGIGFLFVGSGQGFCILYRFNPRRFIPWVPQVGDYVTHKLVQGLAGYITTLHKQMTCGGDVACFWEEADRDSPNYKRIVNADKGNLIPVLNKAPHVIGGSEAVAQVTPPALAQPEPTSSQASTSAIDSLWTDGDVRQWAHEHAEYCFKQTTPIREMRWALRDWLYKQDDAKKPAPRAPVHRPVNLNAAREILEPRIFK
jgi:hypothetical protein